MGAAAVAQARKESTHLDRGHSTGMRLTPQQLEAYLTYDVRSSWKARRPGKTARTSFLSCSSSGRAARGNMKPTGQHTPDHRLKEYIRDIRCGTSQVSNERNWGYPSYLPFRLWLGSPFRPCFSPPGPSLPFGSVSSLGGLGWQAFLCISTARHRKWSHRDVVRTTELETDCEL